MPQTESWTIGRLLQWTTEHFKQRGFETARLDAEVLLAEARGCQRIELYTAFDASPDEQSLTAFRELVRRRAEGTPVAYLVGHKEFYSLNFRVSPDVLIPRPETEFVVIAVLDLLKRGPQQIDRKTVRIADIGTGSGILAVTLARHVPAARLIAVDNSPAALQIASANAREHGVQDRIEFVPSDLLAGLPSETQFDYIVSNPPYVTTDEYAALSPQVRNYEPRQALEAGQQGTDIIGRLIPQSGERLVSGGYLLMEISPAIEPRVKELLLADSRFEVLPTVKDLSGKPRVVQAQRK